MPGCKHLIVLDFFAA